MNGSSWPLLECGVDNHSTCWTDNSVKFNRESQSLAGRTQNKESTTGITISTSSSLPLWLQQCKEETERNTTNDKVLILPELQSLLIIDLGFDA